MKTQNQLTVDANEIREYIKRINFLIDELKEDYVDVRVRQDFPLWHITVTINKITPI